MANFCGKCGTKIQDDNAAFCPNCGNKIAEVNIETTINNKEGKRPKKKIRIIIACILSFAILVVGTIGGLSFFKNKPADLKTDVNYTAYTESFTDVLITDEKSAIEAIASIGDTLGIKDANSELKVTFTNKRGTDNYYRLQQYYKDIPVFGRNITVVADENGKSLGLTANYSPIENIDTKPSLNEEKISEKISKAYGGVDSQTNNGLILYTLYNSSLTLAYDVVISKANENEIVYEQCIVSAENGDILLRNSLIRTDIEHSLDEYTYKVNDKTYLMYDESRNILVLNSNKKLLEYKIIEKDGVEYLAVSNDGKTNENDNPLWDKNKTLICGNIKIEGSGKAKWKDNAVKLINSIENTYDFYSKILNWNGYDNKNSPMLTSYNDYFYSYGNNAYSQGNLLVFGYEKDLTDVGLIGHEFTHSVEGSISGMLYSGESGAIMEAYSDIFGELAEDYAKDGILNGDCDWIHGSRNMIDPSVNNYPARYLDDNWKSTADTGSDSDYGNVHTNNTVISHAAYLMSSGVNGNARIDNKSLAVLWFNALNMLQRDSDLSQCRNAVELSARIMVKNKELTEEQYKCVIAAFKQVGISRAAYTNKNIVKNQFTLSVLSSQKTENVSFNLTIYQRKRSDFDLFGMGFGIPYTGLYEVYNKSHTNGNVELNLESGTYDFYITENSSDSETIITRVVVDKSLSNATDKFTVYTDFLDVITVILNEDSSNTTDAILSPESAVDIYMANKNIWTDYEYMPMQGYGYCLLDLDFDGVLELINSTNDGSGRYSYNKFYRINLDKLTVEEFQPQSEQQEGGIDYYYLAHQSKLLKNKSTGNLFYLFEDYLRVSTEEGVESYAEVYMKDNILYENFLFSEYWHPDYDNNTTNEIREYNFKDNDVTKSEYEQKTNAFYNENKDMNLVWKCISGSEFDKGTDSTQKQLLLDAYRSYSYDGFSYNSVETYDVEVKQAVRVENHSSLTLTGTIIEEAYEINSQNKGKVFILNLDEPIKCAIYDEFMGYNGEEKNIDSVQVNILRGEYEYYKGKTVTLTGSVMIAHTGHHRRDIVLDDCVFK